MALYVKTPKGYRKAWNGGQIPEMPHWSVSVNYDGNNLVTIESNLLSGKPEFSSEEAAVIEMAAQHLLSFVGRRGE